MLRFLLAGIFSLGVGHSVGGETAPTNRLVSEAIPAWQALKEAEEHISFTMHEKKWATQNGKLLDHWSRQSRKTLIHDGSSFLTMIAPEKGPDETYFGSNPRYLFQITRPAASAPYTLKSLDINAAAEARANLRRPLTVFLSIARSRLLINIPLDEVVTDPGIQLQKFEEISADGSECLKVYFTGTITKYKRPLLTSWMILDPKRYWSILKYEVAFAQHTEFMENEYWPESGGISWLRRCKMTSVYPGEHAEENYEYTFDKVDPSPVPVSTFTLSHFGLPEPNEPVVANYQGHLHYWLIGAAIAMFITAYIIRRRAYRTA